VKPAPFAHHQPQTIAEATALLAELEDARVLAGGQSLVPIMAFRLARPAHLIDINLIAELDRIWVDDDRLHIGAGVRHAAFHRPVVTGPLGRLLSQVVRHIAHLPIRARGTFCGSLAHADPAAEWGLVAATLDAEMTAEATGSRRMIAAEKFFAGVMTTTLTTTELLSAVSLPLLPEATKIGFSEFSRRAGDFAMATALVCFSIEDNVIIEPRIGLGAVEATPRRIPSAEAALAGRPAGDAAFADAAEAAAAAITPLEDFQTSAAYRRNLARTVTRRALELAA
jgi:carbon-monoxide dehydrogenase medium subunit